MVPNQRQKKKRILNCFYLCLTFYTSNFIVTYHYSYNYTSYESCLSIHNGGMKLASGPLSPWISSYACLGIIP